MAVQRRNNVPSQVRVDVPAFKSIESAASSDFDTLIQSFVTGPSQGYVLRGFEMLMAGAVGGAASGLQLSVDSGAIFHVTSSESGTFYMVPTGALPQLLNSATNTKVEGAFTPSAINYVGIEYSRFLDPETATQFYLWDPASNDETTTIAPAANVLEYNIVITTSVWASNVLPIAIVVTDSGNNVVDITDARDRLFRLGQGGASPNPFYVYPWTAQSEGRTESPSTSNSNSVNPFHGGDKMLGTLKDWMNAIMSALLEIKGTTYWYSESNSGSLQSLRQDLGNTIVTGNSTITHSKTTAGQINWASSPTGTGQIYMKLVGSRLDYQIAENPAGTSVTLADNQVAYLTLTRGIAVQPNLVFTPNTGFGTTVVNSVGNISWTASLEAGDWVKASADTDAFYYQIQSVDSLTQVTLTGLYVIANMTSQGVKGSYAFGVYTLPGSTGTARDIVIANREAVPFGQDVVWLFMRSDDAGTIPRVYIKFSGAELQQGDSEDISGPVLKNVLQYIGSPIESATAPQYVAAINPGSLPQIALATLGAASTIVSNQYFIIYSAASMRTYYVWFNKDGTGADPMAPATNASVEVDITGAMTAAQVANALTTALNATFFSDFLAVQGSGGNTNKVTITNNSAGTSATPSNFNVGAPFTIAVTQTGTGTGNHVIQDGDNLTLAIKKLDDSLGGLIESLDSPTYDETTTIVASGATPPSSLNGPIAATTNITLPNNSRMGNVAQKYTVGKGSLQLYLNGQDLVLGVDYSEVGVPFSISTQIEILQGLVVGDVLHFRLGQGGGGGGGGGGQGVPGPAGPQGPAGPSGSDAVGGPIAISTKTANYTVLLSDNVLEGNCASGAITFTLPSAASGVGRVFWFKKVDASANPLNIASSDLIDGLSVQALTVQYESFLCISNGSTWRIF